MQIEIREENIIKAAGEGLDSFVELFFNAIKEAIGGELNVETMAKLTPDQITLYDMA